MTEQEKIRFENMMSADQGNWWPCGVNKDGSFYLSLGTVLHFLYMFGNFNMAENCTVGDYKVTYHGEVVATFEWSEKLNVPIFKFIEKYKYMQEQNDFFIKCLENDEHLKWRKKMNKLYSDMGVTLKINF
jgi:hypothetical protein